ncbi:unnamed protein product [Closterium sp. NIES-53]
MDWLSARTLRCVFLGFPVDALDFMFYHPSLHQFLDPCNITLDKGTGAGGTGTGGADCGGARAGGAGVGGAGSGGAGAGAAAGGVAARATVAAAVAAAACAVAAAATAAALVTTCEWSSDSWSSFLFSWPLTVSSFAQSYVSSSGLVSGPLSASFTAVSSCCPIPLDLSLSPGCSSSSLVRGLSFVLLCPNPIRSPPSSNLPLPPSLALNFSSQPLTEYYCTTSPVDSRFLSSLITHPTASPLSILALVSAITNFATIRHFDYANHLVAALPNCPLSAGGE